MRLDKELLDLAAEQQSCVAGWQARLLGATDTEISRLRKSSRWEPIGKRVLVIAGIEHTEFVEASAAVLAAGPAAVLSHRAALALWGAPGYRMLPATVSHVSGRAMRRQHLGDVHDLVAIPERWVTTFKGIRVVRPELAAYQVCGEVSEPRAARTFDNLWSRRLLTGRSARACLEDLAERGRDGTVVYRNIVKARGDQYVPPATNLESRVKELAEEVGLKLRRQVDLGGAQWDGRVDLFEDDVRLIIEVQSELHHTALCDREADAARRARLEADGFAFLEVWDTDVWTRPELATLRMREAVRSRKSHS